MEVTGFNECTFAIFSPNSSSALLRGQGFVNCKIKHELKQYFFQIIKQNILKQYTLTAFSISPQEKGCFLDKNLKD